MDESKQCPACGAAMQAMTGVVLLVHSAVDLPFSRELRWICDTEGCPATEARRAAG
jgi:hypothetical protein